MKTFLGFIVGLVIGLLVLPLCVLIWVQQGNAPVATSGKPLPFERWITGTALHATLARNAPKQSPVDASEPNLMAGVRIYTENCAMCHGTRAEPIADLGRGMYPKPPSLLHGTGVTDDPVGVTYWKVANGIRLTGMPAFSHILKDTQMWQVAQFLRNADHLPPAVEKAIPRTPGM